MNTLPAIIAFTDYRTSISNALDRVEAGPVLEVQKRILIKPNLVNTSPFPVTTHRDCCRAIIDYVRTVSRAEIVIGEGCGDMDRETSEIFMAHGYDLLSDELGVDLIDLNHEPLTRIEDPGRKVLKEIFLPEIAFTHFIISVPVLKAHSLARITGTLKNMMGFLPPKHYAGTHGTWKKATFHGRMQQSLIDLCAYRHPDLTVMDARVGLIDHHLGGRTADPAIGKILAGFDPWECDRKAASLLGMDWQDIAHLHRE